MARTKIEWTDFSWNFILGCSKCSPGCANCYAMLEIGRKRCAAHEGLAQLKPVTNWTGLLRLRPENLDMPLRRTVPTKWFVNSLSDYFHEAMPRDWQRAGLEVMRMADWHVFQILTKRDLQLQSLLRGDLREFAELPNVMWGVSVEDRLHGLPRIEVLRNSPARVKWLSIEPLLEDLGSLDLSGIDWVVVGGESGSHARPIKEEWVISIRDQCEKAGVPMFFKQWGCWVPAKIASRGRVHEWPDGTLSIRTTKKAAGRRLERRVWKQFPSIGKRDGLVVWIKSPPARGVRHELIASARNIASAIDEVEVSARRTRREALITIS